MWLCNSSPLRHLGTHACLLLGPSCTSMVVLMASGLSIDLLCWCYQAEAKGFCSSLLTRQVSLRCPPEDVTGGTYLYILRARVSTGYRWAQVTACSKINASVPIVIAAASAIYLGKGYSIYSMYTQVQGRHNI